MNFVYQDVLSPAPCAGRIDINVCTGKYGGGGDIRRSGHRSLIAASDREQRRPQSGSINHLANHGKPWDGKAMGTKASIICPQKGTLGRSARRSRWDAMLARLLDLALRPKGRLRKVRRLRCGLPQYARPAAGYFASVTKCKERKRL